MAPAPPPQTSASSVLTTSIPTPIAKAIETASASQIPSIEILRPKSTSAPKSIPTSTSTPTLSTLSTSKTSSTISGTTTASATTAADKGLFTSPSGNLTAVITMIIVAVFVAYCVIRCCICKGMRKRKERKELERERGDLERERVRQMREREAIEMAGRMRERSRERMRKDGWEDVLLHGRHVG